MEEKYISKEVFEARMDVFEEKINNVSQELEHINVQLTTMQEVLQTLTAHEKDIESVRRETRRNMERLRRLEGNQSKIVWAVGSAILIALVQFVLNGGLIIKK